MPFIVMFCLPPYTLCEYPAPVQVAFDKLTVDNADQRASMAKAEEDAGGMKARKRAGLFIPCSVSLHTV